MEQKIFNGESVSNLELVRSFLEKTNEEIIKKFLFTKNSSLTFGKLYQLRKTIYQKISEKQDFKAEFTEYVEIYKNFQEKGS